MFNRPGARTLQQQHAGHLFEATIIAAAEEELRRSMQSETITSPLLQRYQELVDADEPNNASPSPERKRADKVISLMPSFRPPGVFGFKYSVQRIELLSTDLIDEPTTEHENS